MQMIKKTLYEWSLQSHWHFKKHLSGSGMWMKDVTKPKHAGDTKAVCAYFDVRPCMTAKGPEHSMASWDGKLVLKSAHCARESCLSETRFLEKSKQPKDESEEGKQQRQQIQLCSASKSDFVFSQITKKISLKCLRNSRDPDYSHYTSKICLCHVPPTLKVKYINYII